MLLLFLKLNSADASEEIFYDASKTYDIVRDASGVHLHQSGGDVDEGEQTKL